MRWSFVSATTTRDICNMMGQSALSSWTIGHRNCLGEAWPHQQLSSQGGPRAACCVEAKAKKLKLKKFRLCSQVYKKTFDKYLYLLAGWYVECAIIFKGHSTFQPPKRYIPISTNTPFLVFIYFECFINISSLSLSHMHARTHSVNAKQERHVHDDDEDDDHDDHHHLISLSSGSLSLNQRTQKSPQHSIAFSQRSV